MPCPIARSLERVGEWWSMLILRDALAGMTRFDEFQESLGIAPNMLTRRLATLVEAGLVTREVRVGSDAHPASISQPTPPSPTSATVPNSLFAPHDQH